MPFLDQPSFKIIVFPTKSIKQNHPGVLIPSFMLKSPHSAWSNQNPCTDHHIPIDLPPMFMDFPDFPIDCVPRFSHRFPHKKMATARDPKTRQGAAARRARR